MAKVELLSPAGSMQKLKTVLRFGADAVYLGGKAFNLRAQSHNFSKDGLKEATEYCHSQGKKIFVTLNIIAHNKEIKALPSFIKYLDEIGVDAVIVADLGVMEAVLDSSNLPIHISTQSSNTNWRSVRMWQRMGAKRVILAREVSIDDMKRIKDAVPDLELEVFVHGSMCMTYSGRCMLSSYMAERDGNRGVCSNTCRWKFALVEEKRPGEYYPVYEDDNGSHIYNSKDLCAVEFIDKIIDAGIDSLKIEGRMKSAMYGATTAKAYRQAIDSYYSEAGFTFDPSWRAELETFSNRGYTTGFYFGKLDKNSQNRAGGYRQSHEIVGQVSGVDDGYCEVDLLNKLTAGAELEVLRPNDEVYHFKIDDFVNCRNDELISEGHANTKIRFPLPGAIGTLDVIRQRLPESEAPEV